MGEIVEFQSHRVVEVLFELDAADFHHALFSNAFPIGRLRRRNFANLSPGADEGGRNATQRCCASRMPRRVAAMTPRTEWPTKRLSRAAAHRRVSVQGQHPILPAVSSSCLVHVDKTALPTSWFECIVS
jgi:hypothetical protein